MSAGFEPVNITPQKQDPAWKHVQMFKNEDRVQLKCIYCGKVFKGGGIHRIKEHLAGQKGNASTCPRVGPDVRLLMQQSLNGVIAKKRKKQKIAEEISQHPHPLQQVSIDVDSFGGNSNNNKCVVVDDDVSGGADVQLISNLDVLEPGATLMVSEEEGVGTAAGAAVSRSGVEKRKRGRPPKKPTTNNLLYGNNDLDSRSSTDFEAHMAIGRFFYDVGLPPDAVNSVYFQPMVDAIASQGLGFMGPTYHDLRSWILKNSLNEAKSSAEYQTRTWVKTGCSILAEEWRTERGRTMVNFLVDSPEGTMFLKSVDITDSMDSEDFIFELIKGVVEEIGPGNILQVITNDNDRYAIVGRRLYDVYPTLYWTPCAASQLSFILDDFANSSWISSVLQQCKSITRFIYNHSFALSMMRRYTYRLDLVVPGGNPSSTSFKTLKRIVELKHNLQALVTSQEWLDSLHSKNEAGLAMLDSISDESFWSSCSLIVRLTDPLLQLLDKLVVDGERKPSMGYAFAGIYRAKETIKKELQKKDDYAGYWHFIDRWWGTHQSRPLLVAGFYLNPKYFYRIGEEVQGKIVSAVFDCIERLVPDAELQDKIMKELNSYKNAAGDFGRQMAIRARETMLPDEWWSTYGGGCPNLARLAVRILSQRCSLVHLKRHLIPFEQIHQTKNSLEHQRLVDLVYTQCNLRLRHKAQNSKEQDVMDPIGFSADSSGVEDWLEMEQYSEDCGSADWMNIEEAPSPIDAVSKPLCDEAEESAFDDYEIFGGVIVDGAKQE